ncbi:MAG: histidinol-phosphatase [Clostridiaceae bacterium]|nr:histidinol-phosphatase [Clostridiaceae bacterium]
MLTNYHTHSMFCDGEMMPEDYVKSAIEKGFKALGFSGHAPLNFETSWATSEDNFQKYIETIIYLKEKYKDIIQIYLGVETDYYPDCKDLRVMPEIDYTIGAIHFIYDANTGREFAFDGSGKQFLETRDVVFKGNIRLMVETYYNMIIEMITNQTPDILAHLDILKKNNAGSCFFDESEPWYKNIVEKTLVKVKEHNIIAEINTGGISRGYTTEIYPSFWIISLMREMDIPIILNSDAHHPDWIDTYYTEAEKILALAGYKSQRILLDGKWQDVPL